MGIRMEKETCATLLKLSSVAIAGAAVAISGRSDDKVVKGVAAGTAVVFGTVAIITGGAEIRDIVISTT